MLRMSVRRIATLVFALANALLCSAQVEQGAITGVVTDQSGASIAGAKLTLTNADTQVTITSQTNNQGNYGFPFLPHGSYSLVAEKPGFSPERVNGISLRVGLAATINIDMKPGNLQQEITVTANVALLDQQSSSLGNVVSSQQIVQLPLNGRTP